MSARHLALLVGENYVNRFNLEGRSYEVIPQVPRAERLDAGPALALFRQDRAAAATCRSRPWSPSRPASIPMRSPSTTSSTPPPSPPCPCRASPWARRSAILEQTGRGAPAQGLQPRLPLRVAAIRAGGQSAHGHLRLRPDHHLSGAGGAVREPARSAGDPGQRADVDLRRAAAALHRAGDHEHLYPGRPGDPDRPDQQARHSHGRVRQCSCSAPKTSTGGPPSSGRPRSGCARS